MLNLTRLQVLTEVLNRGSFSAAADALSYTQSAVSQAIARLEAEVGAPLVVRDRRRIRPTAAGATLLEHATAILLQVHAAEDEVAAVLGLRGGRLRIASFPSAGATLVPRAVATFRERHPDIVLSLAEGEPEQILPRLRAGEIDLAVVFSFPDTEPDGAGVALTRLFEDPLHVVLPARHSLAGKSRLTLGDLHDQDWVQTSADSPCARHVVYACRAAGFEPRVSFESDDYETVQGLVAAGVGVALVPRLALSRVHPGIAVRPLAPSSPTRTISIATPPDLTGAPATRAMLQVLIDLASAYA